jgi:hypothetical protein
MPDASWSPEINWNTPAGRTLKKLFAALSPDREWAITLFGSSPLQLGLEPTFNSADVDLFAGDFGESHDELLHAVEVAELQKDDSAKVYVQACVPSNFRTHPLWMDRAYTTQVGHVRLTLPHPIDILIAKLPRLEDKDLRAYRLVIEKTGHPTEAEMRRDLQGSVDLYRPNFDEELIGDITTNTAILWQELWGKSINVRQEIIAPALEARRKGYEPDLPRVDYKADLRRLAEE